MSTLQVSFTITPIIPHRDMLIAELVELGFEGFEETENGLIAYAGADVIDTESLNHLGVKQLPDVQLVFDTQLVEETSWNSAWESQFQPIQVSPDCTIRAPFHGDLKPGKWDVIIEPKMSFGTGHHATTFLMCEAILSHPPKNEVVLDMGCGTGVLAILAHRLGAKEVDAIDIDMWSYQNTLENIQLNGISGIQVIQGGAEAIPARQYDVILANINRNILLADMMHYSQRLKPEGRLYLSGFFPTDVEMLHAKAITCELQKVDENHRGEWCMLEYHKKSL